MYVRVGRERPCICALDVIGRVFVLEMNGLTNKYMIAQV
jgi:hypothetical protein